MGRHDTNTKHVVLFVDRAVRIKYKSLRTYYVKEVQKVHNSTRSGAGTAGIYVPTWPFFKDLEFLSGTVDVRGATQDSLMPTPEVNCWRLKTQ